MKAHVVPALLLERVLHTNHEGKQGLSLRLPANHWSLRGSDWDTKGLVRWRLAGCHGQSSTTQVYQRCRDGPVGMRRARASGSGAIEDEVMLRK